MKRVDATESMSRRATIYGLIAALCFFIVSASTTAVYYLVEQAVNEKEFRSFMQGIAKVSALLVDGDLHQTFTRQEQHVTEAYKQATAKLAEAVKSDSRIKYIYTFIGKGNSLYYILDPSEPEDFDHDGKPDYETPLMLEEDEAPGLMRKAWEAQRAMVEEEPSPSLWGPLITAYAPIFNSKGERVAVLGMDVTASDY